MWPRRPLLAFIRVSRILCGNLGALYRYHARSYAARPAARPWQTSCALDGAQTPRAVHRLAAAAGVCSTTPATEDGPLYPAENIPWAKDLTRVPGRSGVAAGEIAYLYGRVVDVDCKPVSDATVEIWQADNRGYYKHPRHSAPDGLDPSFRYFAKHRTDSEGRYAFKTIVPKWYRIFDLLLFQHFVLTIRKYARKCENSLVILLQKKQSSIRLRSQW